jgi:hypothetical protein
MRKRFLKIFFLNAAFSVFAVFLTVKNGSRQPDFLRWCPTSLPHPPLLMLNNQFFIGENLT